jgi:dsDNA-specific endonuclease/ATPase MutS2
VVSRPKPVKLNSAPVKKSGKGPTLDLHGFKTEDVFDAVESFLRKNATQKQVRIMPGKGTGKVKAKVAEYLRLANYPWSHERLDNGTQNEGVMIVYME